MDQCRNRTIAISKKITGTEDYVPIRYRPGRKSKWKPTYSGQVIRMGRKGLSEAEMAAKLNVSVTTFRKWREDFPPFQEAFELAMTFSEAYWSELHTKALLGEIDVNVNLITKAMQSRFSETWGEKQKIEQTGKDGGPIQFESAGLLEELKSKIQAVVSRVEPIDAEFTVVDGGTTSPALPGREGGVDKETDPDPDTGTSV